MTSRDPSLETSRDDPNSRISARVSQVISHQIVSDVIKKSLELSRKRGELNYFVEIYRPGQFRR